MDADWVPQDLTPLCPQRLRAAPQDAPPPLRCQSGVAGPQVTVASSNLATNSRGPTAPLKTQRFAGKAHWTDSGKHSGLQVFHEGCNPGTPPGSDTEAGREGRPLLCLRQAGTLDGTLGCRLVTLSLLLEEGGAGSPRRRVTLPLQLPACGVNRVRLKGVNTLRPSPDPRIRRGSLEAQPGQDQTLLSVQCGIPDSGPQRGVHARVDQLSSCLPVRQKHACPVPSPPAPPGVSMTGRAPPPPRMQSPPSPALSTPARSVVWVPVCEAVVMGLKCD